MLLKDKEILKESFLKKWETVFILSLALMIILIDSTVLNVSLSVLIKDLNTDIQGMQWVITTYSLVLASLTITGGRLGDLFGRKRMFVIGAITFAFGSLIAALSTSLGMLALGWSVIEGVGAAMMMPATASLLVSKYKGKDRAIAFGIWGGVAAASTAIGPLLGGFITSNYSWRWAFTINIFVAAVLLVGSILIKEYREVEEKPSLDIVGVILSSLGLLGVVFGVIKSSDYGWIVPKKAFQAFGINWNFLGQSASMWFILAGLLVITLFIFWEIKRERNNKTPLVSMKLFANRQFISGVSVTTIISLGQAGIIFSIPVFIQAVRGEDAFHTGLALMPLSVAAFIFAPLGAFLSHKFPPRYMVVIGLLANASGYMVLYNTLSINSTISDLVPGLVLLGIGMGLIMAQINNITLSAVSSEQSGEASGVNNTFRQMGATLGTAVIGAVLLSTMTTSMVDKVNESKVFPDNFKSNIVEQVGKDSSSLEFSGSSKIDFNFPDKTPEVAKVIVKNEMKTIINESTVDGNKTALIYAAFVAILGVLAAFWLPKGTDIEKEEHLSRNTKGLG